jgi:hypothetical protein
MLFDRQFAFLTMESLLPAATMRRQSLLDENSYKERVKYLASPHIGSGTFSGLYTRSGALILSDDLAALYKEAAFWSDLLILESYIVIEDGEAGPVLAELFKK